MTDQKPDILPATKVGQLLESYPDLEPVLIKLSPAFKKLKNPVLRKTVAKIATLAQAARIGKIPIRELINTLRDSAGLEQIAVEIDDAVTDPNPPSWFKVEKVTKSLDGRPMLDAGEFPLSKVLEDLASIKPGELYKFIAPFLPIPLIEKVSTKGYDCWVGQENVEDKCIVYFTPKK